MHAASSVLRCLAVVLLTACASAPSGTAVGAGGPIAARVPTGDALDESVAAAKLRFNTAARARDIAGMMALFEQGAMVITATGDTLRGRAAIAERVAAIAPASGAVAQLLPRRVEACIDGATEFGGDWSVRPLAASAPEIARGAYAIRWSYDPGAGMQVRTLVLHGGSAADRARGQREVRCVPPHVRTFAARRLELSVSPPRAGLWSSRAGESIGDGMRAQGFTTRALITADGESIQPGLDSEEAESSGAVAIRWRVRPAIVVELFAPFAPLESVVRGYNESESADVAVLHSGRIAGAIASYEWRRLRIGAGPVVMRSTWREREQRRVSVRSSTTGEFLRFDDEGFPEGEAYTSTSISGLVEAGYTYPITARVFLDARAHQRAFASHTTRGTTSLGPVEVDLGGFTAAFGLGVAF